MDKHDLNVAIITGASSGIGEAFVKQVVKVHGIYGSLPFQEIWIIARRTEKLELLKSHIDDPRIVCISADLSDTEDIKMLEEKLEAETPKVGLLINCAGMGKRGNVIDKDAKSIEDTVTLNCTALSTLTRICLPYMIRENIVFSRFNGPRIINVASSAAFLPQPGFAVYSASKAYVVSFSRALDIELRPYHIAVTAVCPGPVATDFQVNATDGQSSEFTGFRKFIVADPDKLAAASIKASRMGRTMLVYGFMQKLLHVVSKIVPTYWIIAFEGYMARRKEKNEVKDLSND
ncbi:MAG: SDR family NAD(P)-dependent oxidoreductase [Saccharofermentans sp.]|nr:SDR family NAD(P)-dependent oxidoreductase [Saccharofermentans sp.]